MVARSSPKAKPERTPQGPVSRAKPRRAAVGMAKRM